MNGNQGLIARFSERAAKLAKARSLSVNSDPGVKSDHIGPHFHRVKVGWENKIDWRSYWMKAQQPVCAWSLKTTS